MITYEYKELGRNMVDDKELLGKAMSQISTEVLALHGKMGPFLDIIQAYLDVKNVKYTIFNNKTSYGEDIRTILIGDDKTSIQISEPIPSWECGTEFFVKTQDKITVSSLIREPTTVIFRTKRDSTDLEIIAVKSAPVPLIDKSIDPRIGIIAEMGVIVTETKNILKAPSKFPGTKPEESYYVLCECINERTTCTGSVTYMLQFT